MDIENRIYQRLKNASPTWLITGVAGFIGSNLLEALLKLNQNVVGIDNFATGFQRNLDEVKYAVGPHAWSRFQFIHGDIRNLDDCHLACKNVDYILHHAALGSVPRSIENPINTNSANINGFLNMLVAAKDAKVQKFIFAGSSSTYGDSLSLPKIESIIGNPLSPYAVTKYVNELYADVFYKVYGLNFIGLRYFNVFGKRQNPKGAYAAVIPKWTSSMILDEDIYINGLGDTSRDFCYVENVIQANILSALSEDPAANNQIYNVACHKQTSLLVLFDTIKELLKVNQVNYLKQPIHRDSRPGDIQHTLASIDKIKNFLDYQPQDDFKKNLALVMPWYIQFFQREKETHVL